MLDLLRRNILKITILITVGAFTLTFSGKITAVAKGKFTCICSYDGYGYYMYLTQFFQYRNLDFKREELQEVQNTYCDSAYVYQLHQRDNGNSLNIYHMGQAYLELPAYTAGHVFAKVLGYPKDGFSKPYHIAFLLNALFFILLGMYFLVRILKCFFSDQVSSLVLLLIYFGSNFWSTAIHAYQLQHIYLFALIALLFYVLLRFREHPEKKKFLYMAAVTLGLISCIRPTHVLLGFLPLFMLKGIFPSKAAYWKSMLVFPIAGLLVNLPQLIYWKVIGGSWFILNMHVEEVVIVDPHVVDFLFSYKKGWLLYSPVFLLLVPGFIQLYKQRRTLFWGIFTSVAFCIWIFASWECWWFAASFGSRAMVDLYPLLAVPLGFAVVFLAKRSGTLILLGSFLVLTFGLSILQSAQFATGYLHTDRMTKAHYWFIFGKLKMPDYGVNRLEIDRSNLQWPETIHAEQLGFGKIETSIFSNLNHLKALPKTSTLLEKKPYFPQLKTDETLFEAQVIYRNNNSEPAVINFETFSKYNVYSWNGFTLEAGKEEQESDTLTVRFNLPIVNHSGDQIQIYVVNPGTKAIEIQSLKIKASSLIRN